MNKNTENDRKKDNNPASAKHDPATAQPHARGGGQTDSATGGKPGGGGSAQSARK